MAWGLVVAGALRAMWQVDGVLCNVAGSWCVLGQGGSESAGGGVLCTMSGWRGGRWQLGLVCHVEAAWRVGEVLACHVGSARWVGSGRAGWRWFAFSRVGWQWWGVGAGWRWLACMNGLQHPG
ncbi:hypothetical protein EDB86DRAFT_2829957 [Lactarius hatsudake]|nr:hypothetical protein EDB86DRAFT_2829957 [Lactarius hatsudake]